MKMHGSWTVVVATVVLSSLVSLSGQAQTVIGDLGAVHGDDGNQRWRDIAANPYSDAASAAYSYDGAQVSIIYETLAPTFMGGILGSKLKPNFAYQLKLAGKPTANWGAAGCDLTNERIGYAGRWYVNVYTNIPGTGEYAWFDGRNSSDTEYATLKASEFFDEDGKLYVFEGYLFFDYVVTDANGAFARDFALDSSFHVCWKTSQRTPGANDSQPTFYTVLAKRASTWYVRNYKNASIGIFCEGEPGRAAPGECALDDGLYNARLFLTEESFHESATGSGYWATVMAIDEVVFEIDSTVTPPPPPEVVMHVGSITMSTSKTGPLTGATATVVISDQDGYPVTGATVSGRWSGATTDTDSGVTASGGTVILESDKVKKPLQPFTFTVGSVALDGATYAPTANVVTSASISP